MHVRCPMPLSTIFTCSTVYPHGPCDVLCLPVCVVRYVWVSESSPAASSHDSSVWVIKHIHSVISTALSQNRLEALWGCWTEYQLQLACSVTVYTITPFKICQLHCWACQNPSDCCLAVSTFPNNISLHVYDTISPENPVPVSVSVSFALFLMSFVLLRIIRIKKTLNERLRKT